jgi:hypothetical protein
MNSFLELMGHSPCLLNDMFLEKILTKAAMSLDFNHFFVSKAARQMIVHHTDRLHEGIADG